MKQRVTLLKSIILILAMYHNHHNHNIALSDKDWTRRLTSWKTECPINSWHSCSCTGCAISLLLAYIHTINLKPRFSFRRHSYLPIFHGIGEYRKSFTETMMRQNDEWDMHAKTYSTCQIGRYALCRLSAKH